MNRLFKLYNNQKKRNRIKKAVEVLINENVFEALYFTSSKRRIETNIVKGLDAETSSLEAHALLEARHGGILEGLELVQYIFSDIERVSEEKKIKENLENLKNKRSKKK